MIIAVIVSVLLAGCTTREVDAVDMALDDHFLAPLQQAEISFAVENTCHLQRDSDAEPWHLEVSVRVDADRDRIAQLIEAEDVVLDRDREVMTIQQEPGDPAGGWNGVLEARDGGGATLGLTHNNVDLDGRAGAGGWAEVCRLDDQQEPGT